MGLNPIHAGSIELDGELLTGLSPATAWARGIAFVPEERRSQGLILGSSISQNISLPHLDRFSLWRGLLNRRAELRRSLSLSQSVQLKASGMTQRVRQLSGGNQQKVVFARAIAGDPRLILLDEPTRGVDVGAKQDLYQLIRQLAESGASILMASSELEELLALCQRILVLREGRLVATVATAGMTESQLLSLMFAPADHHHAA